MTNNQIKELAKIDQWSKDPLIQEAAFELAKENPKQIIAFCLALAENQTSSSMEVTLQRILDEMP